MLVGSDNHLAVAGVESGSAPDALPDFISLLVQFQDGDVVVAARAGGPAGDVDGVSLHHQAVHFFVTVALPPGELPQELTGVRVQRQDGHVGVGQAGAGVGQPADVNDRSVHRGDEGLLLEFASPFGAPELGAVRGKFVDRHVGEPLAGFLFVSGEVDVACRVNRHAPGLIGFWSAEGQAPQAGRVGGRTGDAGRVGRDLRRGRPAGEDGCEQNEQGGQNAFHRTPPVSWLITPAARSAMCSGSRCFDEGVSCNVRLFSAGRTPGWTRPAPYTGQPGRRDTSR
jgi:hypothetical protein